MQLLFSISAKCRPATNLTPLPTPHPKKKICKFAQVWRYSELIDGLIKHWCQLAKRDSTQAAGERGRDFGV